MSYVLYFMSLLLMVNTVFAAVTVFREKRDIAATWAWLLVLNFLPGVGFIIYFFIGKKISKEKIFDIQAQENIGMPELVEAQKQMLLEEEKLLSSKQYTEDSKEITNLFLESSESILTKGNDVEVFIDGKEKFKSLIRDIYKAENHIHMIYYIFHNDQIGSMVLKALEDRAAAGVEVLVIYDALGSRALKLASFKRLKELGGQVETFFGSKLGLINFRINFRNHRKIVVIDGKIGYIGGFNVGDEYLGENKKFGYWRDTHLKIEGNGVLALQSRFIMDWNAAVPSNKLEYEEKYFPYIERKGKTNLQIVSSGPDSEIQQIKKGYIKMISTADESIYIQTPYFVPDEALIETLQIAIMSGIDVKIMIPNKPDHPFIYQATLSYAAQMVEAGAEVYIYDNGFLHSKTIVIDGEICSVGTANFDIRSFKLNFEVNAFMYDPEIAKQQEAYFFKDMEKSYLFTKELIEKQSKWVKFKQSFSRLLSPIL
ncbi:cardiolipin synthase [Desemzia sp. RIT804]|uniref:cardiolipin synthase n=1 Tax=Desemzia sp. RIT 804 TaxID=2810209 RepID=UPI00195288A5|nr:cardiolipin synthase [Desemzia sp. RIT 804]MBM6613637.1 cardiolipin synthase [Desemzia sp. RIT 804]